MSNEHKDRQQAGNIRAMMMQNVTDLKAAVNSGQIALNRHQRRVLAKLHPDLLVRSIPPQVPSMIERKTLAPQTSLLEEADDLNLYLSQLPNYEKAQEFSSRILRYYRIIRNEGLPELQCRSIILRGYSPQETDRTKWLQALIPPSDLSERAAQRISKAGVSLFKGMTPGKAVLYFDEDDEELQRTLVDTSIPTDEILKEGIRTRAETIALMRMHIAWMREHPVDPNEETIMPAEQLKETPEAQVVYEVLYATPTSPAEKYSLARWQVYWTEVPWSSDPNHLVRIPTLSRAEAIQAVARIGRHHISVKPSSIVSLLESHLRKDALAHVMAARLKYVPEEIKDWAKLKRGDDRIPLLILAPETAIFFVGGRDIIYRSLER